MQGGFSEQAVCMAAPESALFFCVYWKDCPHFPKICKPENTVFHLEGQEDADRLLGKLLPVCRRKGIQNARRSRDLQRSEKAQAPESEAPAQEAAGCASAASCAGPGRHPGGPIRILFQPLPEEVHIEKHLETGKIRSVFVRGESGESAPRMDFEWVRKLRLECARTNVDFSFLSTGERFVKDGKLYHIPIRLQEEQAEKADMDFRACEDPLYRLSQSDFRRKFHLDSKDLEYIDKKGMDVIRDHAADFVQKRLAPAEIPNDGRQTPFRGHPVFKAQHASACCCRGCMQAWHGIPKGRELTKEEQAFAVDLLMEWIRRQTEEK